MTDYPAPDLRDSSGRAKRIILALIVAATLGAIAYVVTSSMAGRDAEAQSRMYTSTHGAARFIWSTTALVFAIGLGATLAITNAIAKRKWRATRDVPPARVVK